MSGMTKIKEVLRTPPWNSNCAQATLFGIKGRATDLYEELQTYDPYTSQETGQVCGALYAGKKMRPDLEDLLDQDFSSQVGLVNCDEIRAQGVSCTLCFRSVITTIEINPRK